MQKKIILGSSSPYRKALLSRLNLEFETHSPNIDEQPFNNEKPLDLVKRLTISKAYAVQKEQVINTNKEVIVITSDQIAVIDGKILGKPLSNENAIKQLSDFSGNKVTFLTGLCVLDLTSNTQNYQLNKYHVYFRELTQREIENYVRIEQPLDCAGSFKCEGLGVSLFEKMEGDDPNSLIGLPLISLCALLRNVGINPIG